MAEESSSPSPPSLALHRLADDSLVVWALASFHTAALTAVIVASLYLAGALGDLLGGLDTLVGLGLYLGLWASTWWTTRRAFAAIADIGRDASVWGLLGTAGKWGGVNGVSFFWLLLVGFTVLNAAYEVPLVLLFAAAAGSVLALGVGGIVGLLFAVLDLAAFRAAGRIAASSERERATSDETV